MSVFLFVFFYGGGGRERQNEGLMNYSDIEETSVYLNMQTIYFPCQIRTSASIID